MVVLMLSSFAASKAVGESVEKPLLYYRNNLVSLINLLQLMPVHKIKHLVFHHPAQFKGNLKNYLLPKRHLSTGIIAYGNTKQISEEIIRDAIHSNRIVTGVLC